MNIVVGKEKSSPDYRKICFTSSDVVLFSFKGVVFASLIVFSSLKLKLLNSSADRYENTCSVLSYTSFSS